MVINYNKQDHLFYIFKCMYKNQSSKQSSINSIPLLAFASSHWGLLAVCSHHRDQCCPPKSYHRYQQFLLKETSARKIQNYKYRMGSLLLALFVNGVPSTYSEKPTKKSFSLHSQTSINIYLNVYKCVVYKSTMQFLFYNTHLQ